MKLCNRKISTLVDALGFMDTIHYYTMHNHITLIYFTLVTLLNLFTIIFSKRFATDQTLPLPVLDMMWDLALPKETDRDHRYCNPMVQGPHLENVKKLKRCLIIGYGGDIMVDRQQEFVTMLVKCGVQVEARFDPVGFHNIDMVDPARASAVINIVREFIL
jgi:acetyl esterase/lipase